MPITLGVVSSRASEAFAGVFLFWTRSQHIKKKTLKRKRYRLMIKIQRYSTIFYIKPYIHPSNPGQPTVIHYQLRDVYLRQESTSLIILGFNSNNWWGKSPAGCWLSNLSCTKKGWSALLWVTNTCTTRKNDSFQEDEHVLFIQVLDFLKTMGCLGNILFKSKR